MDVKDRSGIRELLESIKSIEDIIKDARELIRILENIIIDLPKDIGVFYGADEETCQKIAHYLYWHVPTLTTTSIAHALNMNRGEQVSPQRLSKYIGPEIFEGQCKQCGQPNYIEIDCRANLQHTLKFAVFSGHPHPICADKYLCEKCLFARKEQEDKEKREKAQRQRLKSMPYSDYLKTPHWQEIRQKALAGAGFKCQLCNIQNSLHVHHKTYKRRGHERIDDLIVLCEECHGKFHDKLPNTSTNIELERKQEPPEPRDIKSFIPSEVFQLLRSRNRAAEVLLRAMSIREIKNNTILFQSPYQFYTDRIMEFKDQVEEAIEQVMKIPYAILVE